MANMKFHECALLAGSAVPLNSVVFCVCYSEYCHMLLVLAAATLK